MTKIVLFLAFAVAVAGATTAPATVITTRWVDAQRIEICARAPGALYVAGAWAWVGDVDAGCRVYPPPGALIDVVYAPAPGKQYCLLHANGLTCADPLPRPLVPRAWLPLVARN